MVSDCDAVSDIYRTHKLAASAAAASAEAVKAGTDLDCGRTYEALAAAVDSGFVTEAQIDTSVDRLFLARMRLGMFDPPDSVPWSKMGLDDVDQPAAPRARPARGARVDRAAQEPAQPVAAEQDAGHHRGDRPQCRPDGRAARQLQRHAGRSVTPLRGIREAAPAGTRVLYAMGSDLADGLPAADGAPTDSALQAAALDAAAEADAVVLCSASRPALEGEEMRVDIDGFDGGDRTEFDLPAPQDALLEPS